MIAATRRRVFSLIGATPLAAKAAVDAQVGVLAGLERPPGIGNASLGLPFGGPPAMADADDGPFIPYERRIMGAADYIKLFGLPEVAEFELRDRSRAIYYLDADIANKRSWSQAVRIMTQRQRNYEREIEKITRAGWAQRGRSTLKKLLGFDWPW
jgi:hypothetical protein